MKRTLKEWVIFYLHKEETLFEMANLKPKDTGLPMVIWASPKMGKHGPRIKVQSERGTKTKTNNWCSVSISDNPVILRGKLSNEDFKLAKEFIEMNKESLLNFWNDEFDSLGDFLISLKKIE